MQQRDVLKAKAAIVSSSLLKHIVSPIAPLIPSDCKTIIVEDEIIKRFNDGHDWLFLRTVFLSKMYVAKFSVYKETFKVAAWIKLV